MLSFYMGRSEIMEEVWKDITGYEGYYQVSNLGNVRSLSRIDTNGHKLSGKILKPNIGTNGYFYVNLSYHNNKKTKYIHNLVANAFLKNKQECVNHKDGNKLNNCLYNLEFCSKSYNVIHSLKKGLSKPYWLGKTGKSHCNSKSVYQYDMNMNLIKVWECLMDIKRQTSFDISTISCVCNGKNKSCNGYIWRYADK